VLTAISVSVFVALIGVGLFYLSELAGMNLLIRWREKTDRRDLNCYRHLREIRDHWEDRRLQ
jgi:hypothetical protein